MTANRLSQETSPYLLQHAENPVEWYPWGDEALALARDTGKPVLLSVGYSACHWCHVMAHESFEDQATAEVMNRLYVNVKVDREERPDLDRIYQTAHQLLTQRAGGWPLTMFINPHDQRPFFGGTYFPKTAQHGMPPFTEVLTRVADYYRERPDEVKSQGEQLQEIFGRLEPPPGDESLQLDASPAKAGRQRIAQGFDREFGGIGSAPKFPHPSSLDWLLRAWRSTAGDAEPDIDALFMVTLTLTRMAEGGIYDQLGGGFCRYSVDRFWQIPHFEKMLYDNGPLLALYAQLYLVSGEDMYARIAGESADWMISDMQAPDGGFYSSRDADSEGEEGKFYVWTPDEVRSLVDVEAYPLVAERFGLDDEANFEGQWHLTVRKSIADIAESHSMSEASARQKIDDARDVLLAERAKRIAPGRDDKQLTAWNALAIRGLAIAARALERPDLADAAEKSAVFLKENMLLDGRLLATYKDGRPRFAAYLDDHAFLLDALLELLQTRWNTDLLEFGVQLAELMLDHFYDEANGGFFFTADDHEELMHRSKAFADDSMPSGNGIAALALQRLGFLLGENRYLTAVEKTLRSAWKPMQDYPHGHVSLLTALDEYVNHPEIVVVRGDAAEIANWRDSAARVYAPRRLMFAIERDCTQLPGALATRAAQDEHAAVAYRCIGSHCSLPITSWQALASAWQEDVNAGG